jgi:hypothetical protein
MTMRTTYIPTIILSALSLAVVFSASLFLYVTLALNVSLVASYPRPGAAHDAVAQSQDLVALKRACLGLAEYADTKTQWALDVISDARSTAQIGAWFALVAGLLCIFVLAWVTATFKRSPHSV